MCLTSVSTFSENGWNSRSITAQNRPALSSTLAIALLIASFRDDAETGVLVNWC